jgi:hypothetical protein
MRDQRKQTDGWRKAHAAEARAGFPRRGTSLARRAARARLARLLWRPDGQRRLPGERALDAALSALPASELDWLFEFAPLGPLYFLPTSRFVRELARTIEGLGVRRVLEVAAGDGFLAQALAGAAPKLEVIASDSGAWEVPEARMSAAERRRYRDVPVPGLTLGQTVQRLSARAAIRKFAPDLVLAAWLPPSSLLDQLIRAQVRYVLEIGAGSGITASAYSWRFAHEFLEGPVEQHARCRLDARPAAKTHSRVTLYFGKAHPEHYEERVKEGDFLWQFRPDPRKAPRRT